MKQTPSTAPKKQEVAHRNQAEKGLLALRAKIDTIDEKILALLNDRLDIVAQIGQTKLKNNASIYRPERERAIISRLSALPSRHLNRSN